MIRGIHHIALHTPNFERMLAFYRDVLGFSLISDIRWADSEVIDSTIGVRGSAARAAMLRAGNCHLELFEYSSPAPRGGEPLRPNDHGYTHFCLDVTDIEAEYERLRAAGMTFCRAPADFGDIKAVYGKDPDGNVIEIQETSPEHDSDLSKLPHIKFETV